jgi:hypothetical protein
MAKGDEHRMVFDIRGRRGNVVKVIYALLAILMGLSLFLVTGATSLSDLFGGGGGGSVSSTFDDQAAKIQTQLKKQPQNEDLWLNLVRTRYSGGTALLEVDPSTGKQQVTPDARAQFEKARAAWGSYLKLDPKPPNPNVAQLSANAIFALAQTSTTAAEAESNLRQAAAAQKVVADARPSVGAYSNLAYYSYAALEFPQGDEAAKKAADAAPGAQGKQVTKSLAGIRKQAKKFQVQQQVAAKAQQGQGKKELENPLGGLSGGGLGTTTPTP